MRQKFYTIKTKRSFPNFKQTYTRKPPIMSEFQRAAEYSITDAFLPSWEAP